MYKNMRTYVYNICIHVYKFYIAHIESLYAVYTKFVYMYIYIKTEKPKSEEKRNNKKTKSGKTAHLIRSSLAVPVWQAREDER